MEKSYVARNLRKCISYKNILKHPYLKDEENRKKSSLIAASQVDNLNVFNDIFDTIKIKSKNVYMINSIEKSLILRLLSNNIKSCYNISVKSREQIVTNLISFLRESSPYHIHRFDIESFYESIDRESLFKKIKDDGILSKKSIILLRLFFQELTNKSIPGLPRGLRLSAILSEFALKYIDLGIRSTDGVFVYERFVDDIILITDTNIQKKDGRAILEDKLPSNLKLHAINSKKTYFGRVAKPNDKEVSKENIFSYLGYCYTVTEKNHVSENFLKIKRRDVGIHISSEKIRKLKNRLIKSFMSYVTSGLKSKKDYDMLIKRLKFLTGNYYLYNISTISNVKSGIYYNYKLINQKKQINRLDEFLKSLLFCRKSRLSLRIQNAVPIEKRRELAFFSFNKGHSQRVFYKFNYVDFSEIKKVWQ